MPNKKTLIILRHGQAKNAGMSDHDHNRTLTLKGREEAAGVGETLAENGFSPDYVLCSTATRTRETLVELQNFFFSQPPVSYVPKIYNASESDLFSQISAIPSEVNTALLVGHNPALYQLSMALAKEGDKRMHDNLQMQFPTCALVVISFDGEWKNILNSRSKLVLFAVPESAKGL